jgi:hypothetical protein
VGDDSEPLSADREEQAKAKPAARPRRARSRVPEDSIFYTRIVPLLLILMGIVMTALILVALGVLLGWVPWQ